MSNKKAKLDDPLIVSEPITPQLLNQILIELQAIEQNQKYHKPPTHNFKFTVISTFLFLNTWATIEIYTLLKGIMEICL